MKTITKKLMTLSISSVIALSAMTTTVSAENIRLNGLSAIPPISSSSGIAPYDNNIPTAVWNLSTNGAYTVSGKGNGGAEIYTLYRFTGVDSIAISVSNNSNRALKVTLYKAGVWSNSKVTTFTVPANKSSGLVVKKLDAKSEYYFGFSAPCDFYGTIA